VKRPISLAQRSLRTLWLALLPALLAALYVRYGIPSKFADNAGEVGRAFGEAAGASPFVTGVVLFLVFALIIRYWRFWLPGGKYLLHLPPEVAARLERNDLEAMEAALELEATLSDGGGSDALTQDLGANARDQFAAKRAELARALAAPDARAANAAARSLTTLVQAPLRARRYRRALLRTLPIAVAAVAALLLRGKTFQSYRVESNSMLPSLTPGELVLASKLAVHPLLSGSSPSLPRRGDVIVFRRAGERGSDELVKRVIGLPGDHISMQNGFPVINGWQVPHCDVGRYADVTPDSEIDGRLLLEFLGDQAYLTLYSAIGREATDYDVKPGELFVLGDNRNGSLDSRFWAEGKPAGLPLSDVDARVSRTLTRARRDGTPAFSTFFEPLGLDVQLPGIDVRDLNSGIQRCLSQKPKDTHPPRADTKT
jgi:signal peptidase I